MITESKKRDRVQVLNSPVDRLSMQETIDLIEEAIITERTLQHICVNAGKLVRMQKDHSLRKAVVESDIISADGQAVVWASKFLGDPLPERVNGTNLMEALIRMAHEKGYTCFFFGAKQDVVKKVVDIYSKMYSKNIIAGYRNGYFDHDEEDNIAREIQTSNPDILFVAITSPKKEIFLNKYKDILTIPFTMGVGGSFDVIAGKVKRAPEWMQKTGLEWFYRFIQEPKRMWKRYILGNPHFVYLVVKQKLGISKRK